MESARRLRTAAVVGTALVLAFAAQPLVPLGPEAVIGAATLTAAGTLLLTLVLGRRLRVVVAGFDFAGLVAGGIAVTAALRILFGGRHFGHAGRMLNALGLHDVFHTLWFGALAGLLVGSLVVSAVRRWPPTRNNAGFFACHAGVLVALVGVAISALGAVKGRVDLRAGAAPIDRVEVVRAGKPVGRPIPLPFRVSLDRAATDASAIGYRLAVYRAEPDGTPRLRASFALDNGVRHRLPFGASYKVKSYFPDLTYHERVVATEQGGVPAVHLGLDERDLWLPAGGRADSDDGLIAIRFDWLRDGAEMGDEQHHLVDETSGAAVHIEVGETRRLLSGRQITALRFFPHIQQVEPTRPAVSRKDLAAGPALEVEIVAPGAPPTRRFLFSGAAADASGLRYEYGGTVRPPRAMVVISGADRTIRVLDPNAMRELPFGEGIQLLGGRVQLGTLLRNAVRVREPATASAEPRDPAVLVELSEGGETHERLLVASERGAVGFGPSEVLVFEPHDAGGAQLTAKLTVDRSSIPLDRPLSVAGWTVYPTAAAPVSFEVVRDPGTRWVFAGFALIGAGIVYLSYFEPTRRRRQA